MLGLVAVGHVIPETHVDVKVPVAFAILHAETAGGGGGGASGAGGSGGGVAADTAMRKMNQKDTLVCE